MKYSVCRSGLTNEVDLRTPAQRVMGTPVGRYITHKMRLFRKSPPAGGNSKPGSRGSGPLVERGLLAVGQLGSHVVLCWVACCTARTSAAVLPQVVGVEVCVAACFGGPSAPLIFQWPVFASGLGAFQNTCRYCDRSTPGTIPHPYRACGHFRCCQRQCWGL